MADKKFNLKDQLAGIAALIAAIVAIGGGFVKYGEVMTRMSQIEDSVKNYQPFNPDGLIGEMGKQSSRIAVLEKTNQILELEIKELKASNKNPLAN